MTYTTQIFPTFAAFQARADKSINGVSPAHAKKRVNWFNHNTSNKGCWNCVDCFDCLNCQECVLCDSCENLVRSKECDFCKDAENQFGKKYINCERAHC